jgi:putative transposase
MNLVEKHLIKRTDKRYSELMGLCHLSKNLFNTVLYTIRQHWFETKDDDTVKKKFLNYYDVWNILKKDNPDFKAINAHSAQLVIKQVESCFSSFFSLLKLKTQGKYDKKVKLPKYLPKDGYNIISFNQFKKRELKSGYVTLPKTKTLKFKIKNTNLHYINVVPKNDYVLVCFIYKKEEKETKRDNGKYLAIDLGIDNLATCTLNMDRAFIIDGKKVKHINQFYNKKTSEVKSELKKKNNKEKSHKTRQLTLKRNNKVDDYFHKVSRYIISQAVSKDVGTIIVGHNKNWKQEVNIGRFNNQTFVQIPFDRLIQMLKYKGKLEGINVVEIEEGYTSKCSFLDNESIERHETYIGNRIKRGLFRSKSGRVLNSDVNGSLNIMRKYLKCNRDAVMPADAGFVYNPFKVYL